MAATRRLRRLRSDEGIRRLVAETHLTPHRLVLPLFVADGLRDSEPIASMPGVSRWPAESVGAVAKEAAAAGIPGVLVFGVTTDKDEQATRAAAADGPAQRAIAEIKAAAPELVVFADTCLCGYTSHGHCGVVWDGRILNDETVEILAATAVSQAQAGADFVSPSDMMDGRVGAIRQALDSSGFGETGIMAYGAKFASAMYGPFREAADCTPTFGDRRSYQIDPPDARQGMASMQRDIDEGADIVMVKPALAYLDLIASARQRFDVPISAYNVSGEYAMIKAAAERGWLDERRATLEVLTSILRAGADFVISYHSLDAARWVS
jgi:porphobilinogen synthase